MQSAVSSSSQSISLASRPGFSMNLHPDNCHRARTCRRHAQHIELADEIAEYDCAVAGHGDHHRTAGAILNAALITGGGFFRVPGCCPVRGP